MRLLVGKTMVIYNKHGLGMFLKKSPVAQDVASFQLFVGPILISEGPETQSGAVPELIKEAWCRVPVKMWLCDMI